jgi:hypothetical protein
MSQPTAYDIYYEFQIFKAATTLLAAGLAVSILALVVDFFLSGVGAAAFLLTRDFFSIATVVSLQFRFSFAAPYTS